jgi:hypothetical protein
MKNNECENLFHTLQTGMIIEIFYDNMWSPIIDIEEDAHRGWICETEEGETIELLHVEVATINFINNYTHKSAQDIIHGPLRSCPSDLPVLIEHDGLCYSINRIEGQYVKPYKDFTETKCFIGCEEGEEGAIRVMVID